MSWSKFHFNCRFLNQKLSENIGINKAKELLSKSYSKSKIGGDLKENSLEKKLFNKIIIEHDPEQLQTLFLVYGRLNFSWDVSALIKLKNIRNYLFAIFIIFLFLSGIYKYFILPEFIKTFDQLSTSSLIDLEQFNIALFVSILFMLLISFVLLKLYSFVKHIGKKESNLNTSLFNRILFSINIINKIKQIEALLYAPIENYINEFSTEQIDIYKKITSDNLDVSFELQILLNAYRASLLKLINTRIAMLLALFSIIVVGAIGSLVFSIYQPIFLLGTII